MIGNVKISLAAGTARGLQRSAYRVRGLDGQIRSR